jgi:chromosome segregation ATPase
MAVEQSKSEEVDLDKTDVLPILSGTLFDPDVADDAVRLDYSTDALGTHLAAGPSGPPDFVRAPGVDLPSLAESVRSVEERIARQNSEYEALSRSFERLREAESASAARAETLAADLAAARIALESEQTRAREIDKSLAERNAAIEAARSRIAETVRESERHQGEAHALRDALAARDGTIVQVLHSLSERDVQLTALQKEHAKIVPALEARVKSAAQLDVDLSATRDQANATAFELKASQQSAAALSAKLKRAEAQGKSTQLELAAATTQMNSYLERLQTREWRGGFGHNLFRELDAQVNAAQAAQSALKAERDTLQDQVANLELMLAAQDQAIDKLQSAGAGHVATFSKQANDLKHAEQARAGLLAQLTTAETECARLNAELAARDLAIAEAGTAASAGAERVRESQVAAQQRESELAAQIEQLRSEHSAQIAQFQSAAQAGEQEMNVLMAHLLEARQPLEPIQAEAKRLAEELTRKNTELDELAEEHRKTRTALERTRGALEEREFLIRRLERSESNNANVLGRIQTSIERLGAPGAPPSTITTAAPGAEISAELVRVDGARTTTYPLVRRTRVGRANGCELQIDSSSVSRHHALILLGTREAVIEDLNSTNGVILNGHKVVRHLLNDGDAVTIGDVQFRFVVKSTPRSTEVLPLEPPRKA